MNLHDRSMLVGRLTSWGYLDGFSKRDEMPDVNDVDLTEAVRRYQIFHRTPMRQICVRMHGRPLRIDGRVGPITLALMSERMCGCPDPVQAVGSDEIPQSARWPDACKDQITASWNYDIAPGLSSEETQAVWDAVRDDYNGRFMLRIRLDKEIYPRTRIYASLKALPGSTLAWSYLATNNCADRLQQAYDNTIQWSKTLATGTWKHEVGHALGMQHTPQDRDSLMFPSMNGQTTLNQTDINQMVRLGYKIRTGDLPDEPDDPQGPTADKVSVSVLVNGVKYRHQWPSNIPEFPI